MGKFAKALGKYAHERQAVRLPKLTRADRVALISYNRETGHILSTHTDRGNLSMEAFNNNGTLQRLLDHKLIFPDGKLTPKGLAESERLKKLMQARQPAVDTDIKTGQKISDNIVTDDAIIELDQEVEPVEPSSGDDSSASKEASLIRRPAAVKPKPASQPEIKEATEIPAPSVEEILIERDKQEITSGEDNSVTALPDLPGKPVDRKVDDNRSSTVVPGDPLDTTAYDQNLVSLLDPQSFEAEQFKMLRTSILFPVLGEAPKSILVTSPLPGEGKSFVSANLAVSIAMNINKYVLLVDCDLRKPDLHRIFGFGDVPGLSDYLAERRALDSLLLRTTVEKLTLLPGGPIPSNPSELMSSERMSAMLEEVKHRYHDRLIVIDSPPPSLAAETNFLAREVDGIILVVKHGKTPTEEVEDLIDKVGGKKILGAVINHLDKQVSRRYGYGKYGRYGTYGNRYGKR